MNVFLSYTKSDEAIAKELLIFLNNVDGVSAVNHEKLLKPGDEILETIRNWIGECDFCLQLMSNAYYSSDERKRDTLFCGQKNNIFYLLLDSLAHTNFNVDSNQRYCLPRINEQEKEAIIKPINDQFWGSKSKAFESIAFSLKEEIRLLKKRKDNAAEKGQRIEMKFKTILRCYIEIFGLKFNEQNLSNKNKYITYFDQIQNIYFYPVEVFQNELQLISFLESVKENKDRAICFLIPVDVFFVSKGLIKWKQRNEDLILRMKKLIFDSKMDHFLYLIDLLFLEEALKKVFQPDKKA
jgi:hypothetical protein